MTSFTIIPIGCGHYRSDPEQMAGLLVQAKFEILPDADNADIVILYIASKNMEIALWEKLDSLEKQYPHKMYILAGCLPTHNQERVAKYSILGVRQIHHIVEIVEEVLHENKVEFLDAKELPPLHLPRVRSNTLIQSIPIARGCRGVCHYCKCKKKSLESYNAAEIKKEVQTTIQLGAREIWLSSPDLAAYGVDLKTNFPSLLGELVEIPGDFMIHLGRMSIEHLHKIGEELVAIYKHEKIHKYLHLPLYSSSPVALKSTKKKYTPLQYQTVAQLFREKIRDLNLEIDILVGHPEETDEDFWLLQGFIRAINPDKINLIFYSERLHGPVSSPALPLEELGRRASVLTDIHNNLSKLQNERWLGWEGNIIIEQKAETENQWIGRNYAYKPLWVEGDFRPGDVISVKITRLQAGDLKAERIPISQLKSAKD